MSRFPKTEGLPQVSVGRTGQTGGGENAQVRNFPPFMVPSKLIQGSLDAAHPARRRR